MYQIQLNLKFGSMKWPFQMRIMDLSSSRGGIERNRVSSNTVNKVMERTKISTDPRNSLQTAINIVTLYICFTKS